MQDPIMVNGVAVWQGLLSRGAQVQMVEDLRAIGQLAPFRQYGTPGGRKMSVRMSAAGQLGWVTDPSGYRYESLQPNGQPWPNIPASVLGIWNMISGVSRDPDSCLINFYGQDARMGMHQDKDETSLEWPVVSISLGDDALFRVGQTSRGGKTQSIWLQSGDVAVLAGASRLAYHGVDRIKFGTSTLLKDGGRINVTLRVAS